MVKSIRIPSLVVTISMGSKKGRKTWTKSLPIDLTSLPEGILQQCAVKGVSDWIRSAGTREIVERDAQGNVLVRRQATEDEALVLMQARYERLQAGDMDRHMNYVDPITRRACDNVIAALQAQASSKGQTLPEEKVVKAQTLAMLLTAEGKPWMDSARQQLEAENAQAATLGGSIANLLAGLDLEEDTTEGAALETAE